MKKVIVSLIMGLGIVCFAAKAYSREFKEHISKEFVLSSEGKGSTVAIYKVSGFIKVEGYAGNKVLLEMDKTISADDDKGLERGRNEFRVGFDTSVRFGKGGKTFNFDTINGNVYIKKQS